MEFYSSVWKTQEHDKICDTHFNPTAFSPPEAFPSFSMAVGHGISVRHLYSCFSRRSNISVCEFRCDLSWLGLKLISLIANFTSPSDKSSTRLISWAIKYLPILGPGSTQIPLSTNQSNYSIPLDPLSSVHQFSPGVLHATCFQQRPFPVWQIRLTALNKLPFQSFPGLSDDSAFHKIGTTQPSLHIWLHGLMRDLVCLELHWLARILYQSRFSDKLYLLPFHTKSHRCTCRPYVRPQTCSAASGWITKAWPQDLNWTSTMWCNWPTLDNHFLELDSALDTSFRRTLVRLRKRLSRSAQSSQTAWCKLVAYAGYECFCLDHIQSVIRTSHFF